MLIWHQYSAEESLELLLNSSFITAVDMRMNLREFSFQVTLSNNYI